MVDYHSTQTKRGMYCQARITQRNSQQKKKHASKIENMFLSFLFNFWTFINSFEMSSMRIGHSMPSIQMQNALNVLTDNVQSTTNKCDLIFKYGSLVHPKTQTPMLATHM